MNIFQVQMKRINYLLLLVIEIFMVYIFHCVERKKKLLKSNLLIDNQIFYNQNEIFYNRLV